MKTPSLNREHFFPVKNYALSATLASGQVFRWNQDASGAWTGILGQQWLRLKQAPQGIQVETATEQDSAVIAAAIEDYRELIA